MSRFSPKLGAWLLKPGLHFVLLETFGEATMSLWVRGAWHSRVAGTSACDWDTPTLCVALGEPLARVPCLAGDAEG